MLFITFIVLTVLGSTIGATFGLLISRKYEGKPVRLDIVTTLAVLGYLAGMMLAAVIA